jgi:ComF family protein
MAIAAADQPRCDALVPVPLHPTRERARGFNQSRYLAERLSTHLKTPVEEALRRTRRTTAQVQLGVDARRRNVTGAFTPSLEATLDGRSFMLVDDVVTSGSTLGACADALLEAGALTVRAVTAAREM